MTNLFEFILKTSFYGSVVGVLILLVKFILRKQLSPKWSYLLWLVLVLKLVVPIGPKTNFSIFNTIENQAISTIYSNKDNLELSSSKPENKLDQVSATESLRDTSSTENLSNTTINNTSTDTNTKINKGITEYKGFSKLSSIIDYIKSNIEIYIAIAWGIVSINFLAFVMISNTIFNIKLNSNLIEPTSEMVEILKLCKDKLKIKGKINIKINDYISTPALSGIINPKILLPINMVALDPKDLEYVFLHELSHLKRKDNVLNVVLLVLQGVHWFNPFMWYFFKLIKEDIELATDEKVLNVLDEEEHKGYGYALLTVLSNIKSPKLYPSFINMANNKKHVEKRIMNIKFMKNKKGKVVTFAVVGLLSVGIISPLVLTNAMAEEKTTKVQNKVKDIGYNGIGYEVLYEEEVSQALIGRIEKNKLRQYEDIDFDNLKQIKKQADLTRKDISLDTYLEEIEAVCDYFDFNVNSQYQVEEINISNESIKECIEYIQDLKMIGSKFNSDGEELEIIPYINNSLSSLNNLYQNLNTKNKFKYYGYKGDAMIKISTLRQESQYFKASGSVMSAPTTNLDKNDFNQGALYCIDIDLMNLKEFLGVAVTMDEILPDQYYIKAIKRLNSYQILLNENLKGNSNLAIINKYFDETYEGLDNLRMVIRDNYIVAKEQKGTNGENIKSIRKADLKSSQINEICVKLAEIRGNYSN